MRGEGRLWARLLGVERAVVEAVELDEGEDALVCHVRAWKRERGRCGECGRRCPGSDSGEGRRGHWTWARSGPTWKRTRPG
jgi:transposase